MIENVDKIPWALVIETIYCAVIVVETIVLCIVQCYSNHGLLLHVTKL